MNVVLERCAALDIHKKSVAACLCIPPRQETRSFGTMTDDLLALADWLAEHGVTHVAMESTSAYWKPIYNLLEGYGFELLLAGSAPVQGRAWAQDRCPGCPVARRLAASRAAQGQLRARTSASRTA